MNKKISALILILIVAGVSFYLLNKSDKGAEVGDRGKNSSEQRTDISEGEAAKYTINNQESIYFVVNKRRSLSEGYVPSNLVRPNVQLIAGDNPEEQQLRQEAASAAERLFNAADKKGFKLIMTSGYRSAALQQIIFNGYAARDGETAANKYSARPGMSEHQTGLALDISRSDRKCYLEICFGNTEEGKWLAENAHLFGFHLRYQERKEKITGYQFEPWHFRYLGTDLAARLYSADVTMEEFFKLD
jgi:D-alanyl-D-alanine carboxypeptidase